MIALEKSVLGAALWGTADAKEAILMLRNEDFSTLAHRAIATVIRDMIRDGRPVIDAMTVAAELRARSQMSLLPGGSVYLYDLVSEAPNDVLAGKYHAELLRQNTRLRLARDEFGRSSAMLLGDDAQENLQEILTSHNQRIDALPGELTEPDPDVNLVSRLLSEPDRPEDWLIPGLLTVLDRVVITGGEGFGKSWLLRQLAVACAAGVHPFTARPIPAPLRVLQIDAEYSRRQDRAGYRRYIAVRGLDKDWASRITLHIRPQGLDLPGRDAGWFHQVAADCSPQVIVLGPAYKLMHGDPQRDMEVQALLNVVDEVRVRHNAAVIIEQHAPHGAEGSKRPVRPYGSSVWLRWTEVGFGLARDESVPVEKQRENPEYVDLPRWRPSREPRDWPNSICWGPQSGLPWVPNGPYRTRASEDRQLSTAG